MISPATIERHPASKLARAYLKELQVVRDGTLTPLLQLAIVHLEQMPMDDAGYLDDLRSHAYRLAKKSPDWAVSLFCGNPEELDDDIEAEGERELLAHLGMLHSDLVAAGSAAAVGKLLVENLYNSLQHHYPGFGRQYA